MQKEKWDLYDKDGNHKGIFVRGKGRIPDGLYHKTVEILPSDMEGRLLLTRRSMLKASAPGKLEFPAGSVIAGETEIEAALRELKEETGLRPAKLFFLQRARTRGIIRYTYLAFIPEMTKQQITYDPDEIMNHVFVTYEQWLNILTSWEFNSFRTSCYNDKLLETVKELVNRHAVPTEEQPIQHAPLRPNSTLAIKQPRILDERCYEKDPNYPPELDDWEPDLEQGDDLT